jgi:hypothetical protein
MMPGGCAELQPVDDAGQPHARPNGDGVQDRFSWRRSVEDLLAYQVRQVRMQSAAEGNVDYLRAAADPQSWRAVRDDLPRQPDLGRIARCVQQVSGVVIGPAIRRRLDVAAAGEDQSVHQIEQSTRVRFARRKHIGTAPALRMASM